MRSMARIEAAIQKLSAAEQRIIARRLGERLAEAEHPAWRPVPEEGIRFLTPYGIFPAPRQARSRKVPQRAATAR